MNTQRTQIAKFGILLSWAIFLAVVFGNNTHRTFAESGNEVRREGHNLLIRVDSRWVGCRMGGYLPIRMSLLNSAADRTLRIRFDPGSENLPAVERKVRLPQNEKVITTLSIPMVSGGEFGQLQFFEDGKHLESLKTSINLPGEDRQGNTQPACLILSETNVAMEEFLESMREYQRKTTDSGISEQTKDLPKIDVLRLAPTMLPTSWIDYSGVDLVVVSTDVLTKLDLSMRQAILKWAQSGGTLIVSENGKNASDSIEINRLLFSGEEEISSDWKPAELNSRFTRFHNERNWPRDEGFVQKHRYLMGKVFVFRENPFRGNVLEWNSLMNELDPVGSRWFERMGLSARDPSGDFRRFQIEGIKSVPIYAFLVLISLFTILIGPLNYFVLWKRKKLFLLIATIPGIAFVTSLVLFGYSIFSNGLGIKTRVRSVTVIDQRTQTAVTSSRNALFAGLPPSEGLVFSNDTAVFPIWPKGLPFTPTHIEWDDRQKFDQGWIRSRTRTQFLTITHRKERGRLEVEKIDAQNLRVTNGFKYEMTHIVVSDEDGNLFGYENFKAGSQVDFSLVDTEFLDRFLHQIEKNDYRKEITNFPPRQNNSDFGTMGSQFEMNISFIKNKAEKILLQNVKRMKQNEGYPPRMYFAILKTNPGVDLGVEEATELNGFHVLIGYY